MSADKYWIYPKLINLKRHVNNVIKIVKIAIYIIEVSILKVFNSSKIIPPLFSNLPVNPLGLNIANKKIENVDISKNSLIAAVTIKKMLTIIFICLLLLRLLNRTFINFIVDILFSYMVSFSSYLPTLLF